MRSSVWTDDVNDRKVNTLSACAVEMFNDAYSKAIENEVDSNRFSRVEFCLNLLLHFRI